MNECISDRTTQRVATAAVAIGFVHAGYEFFSGELQGLLFVLGFSGNGLKSLWLLTFPLAVFQGLVGVAYAVMLVRRAAARWLWRLALVSSAVAVTMQVVIDVCMVSILSDPKVKVSGAAPYLAVVFSILIIATIFILLRFRPRTRNAEARVPTVD